MEGPFTLSVESVNDHVSRTSAGAYILSRGQDNNGKWVAHYVGRSDNDVAARLKSWANAETRYERYWFEYASSARGAFLLECQWWHKYAPSDNERHPAVPKGSDWKCPVTGRVPGLL